MKRIFSVVLMMLLVCGCSAAKTEKNPTSAISKSDPCDFLINAKWEGNDGQCSNVITFKEDGGFANWCYCGSEIGDADLVEKYVYRAEDNSVLLYNADGKNFETGKILYVDKTYLIIKLWSKTLCYENMDAYRPKVHIEALEEVNPEGLTWPCLTVLDYKDGLFTVSDYNYDGDAKDNFKTWELKASEDVSFKTVSVKDDNGNVSVTAETLNDDDIQHIGEYYTYGYFEINRDGQVQSIVFYGELVIQG